MVGRARGRGDPRWVCSKPGTGRAQLPRGSRACFGEMGVDKVRDTFGQGVVFGAVCPAPTTHAVGCQTWLQVLQRALGFQSSALRGQEAVEPSKPPSICWFNPLTFPCLGHCLGSWVGFCPEKGFLWPRLCRSPESLESLRIRGRAPPPTNQCDFVVRCVCWWVCVPDSRPMRPSRWDGGP